MGVFREALQRLVSKPVTSKYPKEKAVVCKGLRGKVKWHKNTCIWCKLCEINCPAEAIKIDKEKKEWSIDSGKCIFCGRCEEVCPTKPKKSVTLSKEIETATKNRAELVEIFKGDPLPEKQPEAKN